MANGHSMVNSRLSIKDHLLSDIISFTSAYTLLSGHSSSFITMKTIKLCKYCNIRTNVQDCKRQQDSRFREKRVTNLPEGKDCKT